MDRCRLPVVVFVFDKYEKSVVLRQEKSAKNMLKQIKPIQGTEYTSNFNIANSIFK
jgi:hypothetical protein